MAKNEPSPYLKIQQIGFSHLEIVLKGNPLLYSSTNQAIAFGKPIWYAAPYRPQFQFWGPVIVLRIAFQKNLP